MNSMLFEIIKAKPFLKWAGGKTQILSDLEQRLPERIRKTKIIKSYVEPFIGGGAFFFYLISHYDISESVIMDINPELVVAYTTVKNTPGSLIKILKKYEYKFLKLTQKEREKYFYKIRSDFNKIIKSFDYKQFNNNWLERTSQLIFLNRTCFNGLYRQNKKGEFNVPYGNYKNPTICNSENLIECSKVLKNTKIILGDFSISKNYVKKETLVYLDPPYRPIKKTASFTSYSKDGFNDDDQKRLAEYYLEMSNLGAYLLLSNSDPKNENRSDDFFEDIYHNFKIEKVPALRMINCNGSKRGRINELVIMNYSWR